MFTQAIAGPGNLRNWFNKAAFVAPANGYGTASRNSVELPGTVSMDLSLSKSIAFGELKNLEMRATATNPFKHRAVQRREYVVELVQFRPGHRRSRATQDELPGEVPVLMKTLSISPVVHPLRSAPIGMTNRKSEALTPNWKRGAVLALAATMTCFAQQQTTPPVQLNLPVQQAPPPAPGAPASTGTTIQQQGGTTSQSFTLRVDSQLVLTNVVVRDRKTGGVIRDLKASDFTVLEKQQAAEDQLVRFSKR